MEDDPHANALMDEHALIARAVDGEADALNALAAAHRPAVVRTATHVLGDAEAAEDVAQDVLARMGTALAGFRGDAELGTWLYRMTVNRCKDVLRRRRHLSMDGGDGAGRAARLVSVEPDPGGAVDAERRRRAVRAAIARLPEEQREVVTLRYLSDLSYAEIARVTRLPHGTVATRVFRGLARLGRDLESRHLELLP